MADLLNTDYQELTPPQIVEELDKYIIGQEAAKKAVAIALRNRFRRKKIPEDLRDEVAPKNIIMIGPTGVGKTEIARRLANLANAPFIKVEATKYTEVGYVGRDVESMIRDITAIAVNNEKNRCRKEVEKKAEELAEDQILDILVPRSAPMPPPPAGEVPSISVTSTMILPARENDIREERTREKMRKKLRSAELEEKMIEIELAQNMPNAIVEFFPVNSLEQMDMNLQNIMGGIMQGKKKNKKMSVTDARKYLIEQSAEKLIDMDKVVQKAISDVENMGIIFLDEIDKIASRESHGPDVSRQGVQRDLLPLVEGSSVSTRFGVVKTDHILFIAAGAFHETKPSDLIPELQGRFPIRVELKNLDQAELKKILTIPKNALTVQYTALLATEGITLVFTPDAIDEIASITNEVNHKTENIGARRLHTILEKILEDISYKAPDLPEKTIEITSNYVRERLKDIVENRDLSQYIL